LAGRAGVARQLTPGARAWRARNSRGHARLPVPGGSHAGPARASAGDRIAAGLARPPRPCARPAACAAPRRW